MKIITFRSKKMSLKKLYIKIDIKSNRLDKAKFIINMLNKYNFSLPIQCFGKNIINGVAMKQEEIMKTKDAIENMTINFVKTSADRILDNNKIEPKFKLDIMPCSAIAISLFGLYE